MHELNILAADIGGSTSRFSFFLAGGKNGSLTFLARQHFATQCFPNLESMLEELENNKPPFTLSSAHSFILALPGPITADDRIEMANIPWPVVKDSIQRLVPLATVAFINDFAAQAHGCLLPQTQSQTTVIRKGQSLPEGRAAVIGAGTGLGHCTLLPGDKSFRALPSEAGQCAFPFEFPREREFVDFLSSQKENGSAPSNDLIVSGPGLALLWEFFSGQNLSPTEATKMVAHTDTARKMFSRFYARAIRNFTLCTLALAGVYITGGVAANNPEFLKEPEFHDEFLRTPRYRKMLESIPLTHCWNPDLGLWGAAHLGTFTQGVLNGVQI